jgi:hypothetical protein
MNFGFFTWDNFITWAVCAILIYLSLNFRIYMIFHHPDRKLRRKVAEKRLAKPCVGPLCPKGAS